MSLRLITLTGMLLALALAGTARAASPDLWSSHGAPPQVVGAYLSLGYWNAQDVETTFNALQQCGVNLVIDYALTPPEDENWRTAFEAYLDSARAHGIGVAFCLYPLLAGMNPQQPDGRMDAVVDMVEQLKGYPGITAWYVHDEILPSIAGDAGTKHYTITLDQMQQLYRRIHRIDPVRPQLCVWNFLPGHELFNRVYKDDSTPYGRPTWMWREGSYERALQRMVQSSADWVLADCYPVGAPWREADAPPEVEDVASLIRRIAALKRPDQPLIFVFQSFSWEQYNPDKCSGAPFPTLAQMEQMLGAAAACGATGVVAYSWFDLAEAGEHGPLPGQDAALQNLMRVLASLSRQGWPAAPPLAPVEQETPAPADGAAH